MNPRVEFDLTKLDRNIKEIKNRTNNINFLFPVKCCKKEEVLDIIFNNGLGFDVSNKNEYEQIEKYVKNRFVSACGPLSYELDNYSNIHVISNNLSSYKKGKGLRVNFNSNNKFGFSRFGEDYKNLDVDIRNEIAYIHFHNSDYRDLNKCNYIYEEIKSILEYFPNIKILNIGGHLEDLSFEDGINYLNEVRNIVPNNIAIYAELGDFLFKDTGTLYAKVVDIRNDKDKQIVSLNFIKMVNQRWTYPIYKTDSKNLVKTVFYGSSCCETDVYLETETTELSIGDEVVFTNISPYSYELNATFSGIDKIEFIFK